MKRSGMARCLVLHSFAAGAAITVVSYTFTAYLDPTVFMALLGMFAFCQ
jgi:hypothetical protein